MRESLYFFIFHTFSKISVPLIIVIDFWERHYKFTNLSYFLILGTWKLHFFSFFGVGCGIIIIFGQWFMGEMSCVTSGQSMLKGKHNSLFLPPLSQQIPVCRCQQGQMAEPLSARFLSDLMEQSTFLPYLIANYVGLLAEQKLACCLKLLRFFSIICTILLE